MITTSDRERKLTTLLISACEHANRSANSLPYDVAEWWQVKKEEEEIRRRKAFRELTQAKFTKLISIKKQELHDKVKSEVVSILTTEEKEILGL
jgi:hypothetical protein